MNRLYTAPWDDHKKVTKLAEEVCLADQQECLTMTGKPVGDILRLVEGDKSWFVVAKRWGESVIVGAFGWTEEGQVWSTYVPLSKAESLELIRITPFWTKWVVEQSGMDHLHNIALKSNKGALGWLRLSGAFDIEDFGDKAVFFRTKPIEELTKLIEERS